MADCFQDCEKKSPTQVLATAIYCTLEKKYFDERTPGAEIATMFCITTAQFTKAVPGVDYESGLHSSAKKRKTTDAAQTMPSKLTKTTADSTPSTLPRLATQQWIMHWLWLKLHSQRKDLRSQNYYAIYRGMTKSYLRTVQHSSMTPCHHPVTLIPCQECLSSELFSHNVTRDIPPYYNYNP